MKQHWTQTNYFQMGTQYYAAGRFAVFGRLIPVCGNLLHHAIEMYLKGFLCTKLSEKELRDIKHDLVRAWRRFRDEVKDTSLDRFDEVMSELNHFERLRYPEKMLREGAQMFIGPGSVAPAQLGSGSKNVPTYRLSLGLIDELVGYLFRVSSMNPPGFSSAFGDDAQAYLRRENVFSI